MDIFTMAERIHHAEIFYYAKYSTRDSEDPLGWRNQYGVFGIGVHEQMPARMVRHGGRDYPWLLMYFHTPAIVLKDGEPVNCENSMILWEPEKLHNYGNVNALWDHSWIIFRQDEARQMVNDYHLPLNTPVHCPAGGLFEKYLRLFYAEVSGGRKSNPGVQKRLLDLFLYELSLFMNQNERKEEDLLQRIKEYMTQNLSQPLTAVSVAEYFAISVSYLMFLFKRGGELPPMRYLNVKRMETAAFLIKCYPFSCKEVAAKVGFADSLHFSRRFKAFHGTAPLNYKKQQTGNQILDIRTK